MFIVVLEFNVKPGLENKFLKYWQLTTDIIYKNFGSLGSRLHISDTNTYIAYAQWPSLDVYETEQDWSEVDIDIRNKMRETLIDGQVKIINKFAVMSDLTRSKPYQE